MKFDEENKAIIETLNREEAMAFIKFLGSEIVRHKRDIEEAEDLIEEVQGIYELPLGN